MANSASTVTFGHTDEWTLKRGPTDSHLPEHAHVELLLGSIQDITLFDMKNKKLRVVCRMIRLKAKKDKDEEDFAQRFVTGITHSKTYNKIRF